MIAGENEATESGILLPPAFCQISLAERWGQDDFGRQAIAVAVRCASELAATEFCLRLPRCCDCWVLNGDCATE